MALRTLLVATLALAATAAHAHISVSSGNAVAFSTQEITFGVGHGCEGATEQMDTYSIKIDVPAGFTSVRAMRSDFGSFVVEKNLAGAVVSVTWTKPNTNEQRAHDEAFYKLVLRMKPPNLPLTTHYFAVHQFCRDDVGNTAEDHWVGTPSAPATLGAASLNVVPARQPGWNKYTATDAITDLSVFFKDAVIVWKGTAAYSFNPNTTEQIAATAGVTALTEIQAGEEFWVKY